MISSRITGFECSYGFIYNSRMVKFMGIALISYTIILFPINSLDKNFNDKIILSVFMQTEFLYLLQYLFLPALVHLKKSY